MRYEVYTFEELMNLIASCENLGLFYIVQKDSVEVEKWFGRKEIVNRFTLTVVEYINEEKEVDENA